MAYIEEFCPKEEYHFEDETFYLIYKTDDAKEELYNLRTLEDLDITDRITNITCVTVRERQ